ncbi:unnamed protein product [Rotaria sp. Silwood2]|nr:unnamed protein product [Rotaria sp. Silwood2]CAF3321044.1 unnamed protein product [Rotaria sp. Silwood2]CAF3362055.1 unnamed protein product [Rotaria sp. Silwood2]CAF4092399.1 unnamed protein product [Rotaria sp. Silwood2]CAF4207256.1 unnamed protein product [Rotaria sp. Silwood2]
MLTSNRYERQASMFDKSKFKISTCNILPMVRDFFKQPTGERDLITNIDELRRYLSDIKPFSRILKSLQNKILQEAWYECYPEQRTIVRQGDRPACFYIILSGSAIITYKRVADSHIETLAVLHRGCTFGEKGIMTDSRQKFTITSKTKLELLVLWKDDFKAIYMTDDRYCSKDDLKFLKNNVPFLRGFSIDQLNEFPHAIQHCNYGQSEVIAQDSRLMRHIFIVKSGSLEIWKRLDPNGYIPKLSKHDLDQIKNEKMVDDTDDVHEATADDNALFSEIQLSGGIDESTGTTLDTDSRLSRLRRSKTIDGKASTGILKTSDSILNFEKKFPGVSDKRERLQLIDYDELLLMNQNNNEPTLPLIDEIPKPSRPTIKKQSKLIFPSKTTHIHIKTLNEGQHFGLNDMLFPNQSALTLVSNKCECLLLLKSSFVRIATDQYKQNIRRTEIPFPSDSDFYKSYHRNEVWKRYSKEVYKDARERMNQQHQQPIKHPSNSYQNKQKHSNLINPI